jgi:ABC-type polysaccharide/polyol phosphate export permease
MVLNPFSGILELYRVMFFSHEWVGWHAVAVAAVETVIIFFIGLRVFSRLEGRVLKEI